MKKADQQSISNLMNLWWKVHVEDLGFNNLHQDFKIMKNVVWTVIDIY